MCNMFVFQFLVAMAMAQRQRSRVIAWSCHAIQRSSCVASEACHRRSMPIL